MHDLAVRAATWARVVTELLRRRRPPGHLHPRIVPWHTRWRGTRMQCAFKRWSVDLGGSRVVTILAEFALRLVPNLGPPPERSRRSAGSLQA